MRPRRGGPGPWPPPVLLLLLCLSSLLWASPVTAQTTGGPLPPSASRGLPQRPGPGGPRLTTTERETLCDGPTLQPSSADGSSRTRRSSERSPYQQLVVSGGDGTEEGPDGCLTLWDGVLCWPATSAGLNRTLPCFHELRGVLYDASGEWELWPGLHSAGLH